VAAPATDGAAPAAEAPSVTAPVESSLAAEVVTLDSTPEPAQVEASARGRKPTKTPKPKATPKKTPRGKARGDGGR
jgi:hypothetical protein